MIVRNAIKTPDGTILESTHRHDFKGHTDANGEYYFVDGGRDYIRRSANTIPAGDLTITTEDPHEAVREAFSWGVRKDGGVYPVLLKDLTTAHIEAILETQTHISEDVKTLFRTELKWRGHEKPSGQAFIQG